MRLLLVLAAIVVVAVNGQSTIKVRTVGNCDGATYLTSIDQCLTAGRALGLLDRTPTTLIDAVTRAARPPGCYYDPLRTPPVLVWNPRQPDGSYSEDQSQPRLSICATADAAPMRIVSRRSASHCQLVGNCLTDGDGQYGDREDCRVEMLRSGTLSALVFQVESHVSCRYDYLKIGATKFCGEDDGDFEALQNVSVGVGTAVRWWTDRDTTREGYTVCFRDDATSAPTAVPTAVPSRAPTASPSQLPSKEPTQNPTGVPSPRPTAHPITTAPTTPDETFSPTTTPTADPSGHPTTMPTRNPTGTPSGNPTGHPTTSPASSGPSTAPSIHPTPSIAEITFPPTQTGATELTKRPTPAPTVCDFDCDDDDYYNDGDFVPASSPGNPPPSPPPPSPPPPPDTFLAASLNDEDNATAIVVSLVLICLILGVLIGVVMHKRSNAGGDTGHNPGFGFFGVDMKTIPRAKSLQGHDVAGGYSVPNKKKKKPKAPGRKTGVAQAIENAMYVEPTPQDPGEFMYDNLPLGMPDDVAKRPPARSASIVSRIDGSEALYDLGTTPQNNGHRDDDDGSVAETDDDGYLDVENDGLYEMPVAENQPEEEEETGFGFN